MAGDRAQALVVGREHHPGAEGPKGLDEPFLVGQRARGDHLRRVPRAEAERARLVVDREDADAGPSKRPDRGEAVDEAHVDDDRRWPHVQELRGARRYLFRGCFRLFPPRAQAAGAPLGRQAAGAPGRRLHDLLPLGRPRPLRSLRGRRGRAPPGAGRGRPGHPPVAGGRGRGRREAEAAPLARPGLPRALGARAAPRRLRARPRALAALRPRRRALRQALRPDPPRLRLRRPVRRPRARASEARGSSARSSAARGS